MGEYERQIPQGKNHMNMKKPIVILIVISVLATGGYFLYQKTKTPTKQLFTIEKVQRRTIKHTIATSGVLEIKDVMKVGSFQVGTVKEIYVKENQTVKRNQILAFIDIGKNNTEVKEARHTLAQAQKEFEYQEKYFARQKVLYQSGQLAKDTYQKVYRDYSKALEDVKTKRATLDKNILLYESIKIKAPEDGLVIAVHATKGAVVSDVSNSVLFEIAQDITKMKATLDIDESEIGHIKQQQKTVLVPNSFPDMRIKSNINEVSFVPKLSTTLTTQAQDTTPSYKAIVDIDNSNRLFRPGMIANATISIAKAKNVISISNPTFYINPTFIQMAAQIMNFEYKPLAEQEQKKLRKADVSKIVKFVWIKEGNAFIQKAVTLGLTDNMYSEIKEGLAENQEIISDVEEPNEMDEIYKKWFRGSL